jgi:hypothetical protein
MPRPRKTSAPPKDAEPYRHPEADLPARPEIGARPHLTAKMTDPRGNLLLVVKKLKEAK